MYDKEYMMSKKELSFSFFLIAKKRKRNIFKGFFSKEIKEKYKFLIFLYDC